MTRQLIVMGTGRCGTSAVAGILHHLGVHMGDKLRPPAIANPEGKFEDEAFLPMNRLVADTPIPPRTRQTFYQEYVGNRNEKKVWGLKDPWLAWTFHFLLPFLDDVRVIVARRPREECIVSSMRSYGPSREAAVAWYDAVHGALQERLGAYRGPLLQVEFADLLADPGSVVKRIVRFAFDGLPAPTQEELDAAVEHIRPRPSRPKRQGKPRVLVAILNQGQIRFELANLLIQMSHDPRVVIKIIYPNARPQTHNRNKVVAEFLNGDWDFLLMVDNDSVPQQNPLDLVEYDKDFIGLPCPIWDGNAENPNDRLRWNVATWSEKDGAWKPCNLGYQSGLFTTEGLVVGSGCILIARRLLEHPKMKAPFRRVWNEEGFAILGHDFRFCQRAERAGFTIWAHLNYWCKHFHTIDLDEINQLYRFFERRDDA